MYRWLAADGREPVVELPVYPSRARRLWAAYLYFSTYHWRPIPIGRTSFYPPAHEWLVWNAAGLPGRHVARVPRSPGAAHDRRAPARVRRRRPRGAAGRRRRGAAAHAPAVVRRTSPAERFAALGLGDERVYALAPAARPSAPCVPRDEIPREGWTVSATGVNKPDRVATATRTRAWMTDIPQRPGDRLEVDLGRTETVAAVALDIGYPHEEFGRNLVLAVDDGRGWQRVPTPTVPPNALATLDDLLQRPREARMVLRVEPRPVRRLRLLVGLREEDPAWPRWSVPELRLFARCQ